MDLESIVDRRRIDTMGDMRKRFSTAFKAKVAVEALKGEKTIAELSSE